MYEPPSDGVAYVLGSEGWLGAPAFTGVQPTVRRAVHGAEHFTFC